MVNKTMWSCVRGFQELSIVLYSVSDMCISFVSTPCLMKLAQSHLLYIETSMHSTEIVLVE